MTASNYSVTPRTVCIRSEDGTRSVMLFTEAKDATGAFHSYCMGGSYCLPGGEWVRTYEHPQEWDESDMDDERDQFLSDGEADEAAMASAGHGEDESYGYYGGGDE
jgi:hypothetical protein